MYLNGNSGSLSNDEAPGGWGYSSGPLACPVAIIWWRRRNLEVLSDLKATLYLNGNNSNLPSDAAPGAEFIIRVLWHVQSQLYWRRRNFEGTLFRSIWLAKEWRALKIPEYLD